MKPEEGSRRVAHTLPAALEELTGQQFLRRVACWLSPQLTLWALSCFPCFSGRVSKEIWDGSVFTDMRIKLHKWSILEDEPCLRLNLLKLAQKSGHL